MNWLFKEEPSNYNFDAFAKDKQTTWTGVKNPVAQRNLGSVKKGDRGSMAPDGSRASRAQRPTIWAARPWGRSARAAPRSIGSATRSGTSLRWRSWRPG